MSGFTENRASGASEQSGAPATILTWHACRAMLPLVSQIARDIGGLHQRLLRLRPELAHLERNRRALTWPQRSRRYQLEEEIAATEAELRSTVAELDALGVALLDAATGLVGFPTLVNERRAYFSWKPGEDAIACWNYADDRVRRPVPEEWTVLPRDARVRRSRQRKR